LPYVFQVLKEFVEDHELKFDVSATIQSKKLWDTVIVGGKITRTGEDIFHKGNYFIELDDDVGTIGVYAIAQVATEYPQILEVGNVVLIKGYVIEKAIDGTNTVSRYVAACSVELIIT
jgi:hypothetical protein